MQSHTGTQCCSCLQSKMMMTIIFCSSLYTDVIINININVIDNINIIINFRLCSLQKLFHYLFFRDGRHHYSSSSTWFAVSISVVFSLLSLSRSSALYYGNYC